MKTSRLDKAKVDILRMYWEQEYSTEQIAEIYKISDRSVQRWLEKNGGIRPHGRIKQAVSTEDEVLIGGLPQDYDNLGVVPSATLVTPNEKGEIFESMCEQILESLHKGKISKPEAQLKYMFLEDEYEELGSEGFDKKYINQVS